MSFIKKHYEKVLLGAVLLGLVGAVAFLLLRISSEKDEMEQKRNTILAVRAKPLPQFLDTNQVEAIFRRVETAMALRFAAPPHNLINPVPWEKTPDGSLAKVAPGKVGGVDRVELVKVSPLYLIISLESYNAAGLNYLIKVENETERGSKRRLSRYVAVGGKMEGLTLREVKGPPDQPTELVGQLAEGDQRISFTPDTPYRRVEGYMVDLKYEPEKLAWKTQRVLAKLRFASDEFTIASINLVATNQYEVVLSAKSTGKKTTLKFNAEPSK